MTTEHCSKRVSIECSNWANSRKARAMKGAIYDRAGS